MALKKQKSLIPLPEKGNIPARLARIIEIGEHKTKWGVKPQVQLYFSLPTRIINQPESDFHGKQHMVRTFPQNLSSNKKAGLVTDYIKVMDPGFDLSRDEISLSSLLNKTIYLTIDNNKTDSGEYCNIMNTMGVPEGMDVGELDTTPFYLDWDNPDPDVWHKYISDFAKEKIQKALNYSGSPLEAMVMRLEAMSSAEVEEPVKASPPAQAPVGTSNFEDDIPF